jgi:hypothetical protein
MAETIANPEPAKVISRASECMRRLLEAGLTYEDLQKPINDPEMRRRLMQFWKGRAPETAAASYSVTIDYGRTIEEPPRTSPWTTRAPLQ